MVFITINEGFICEVCGVHIPPAQSTCRNHCTQCLASKHVDDAIPGDRASTCHGIMNAISVEGSNPEKLDLVHKCTICGKLQRNKIAPDDARDAIFGLIEKR